MRKKNLDAFKKTVDESIQQLREDLNADIAQAVVDILWEENEFEPSLHLRKNGIFAVWLAGKGGVEIYWEELIDEFCEDDEKSVYRKGVCAALRKSADEIEKRCK